MKRYKTPLLILAVFLLLATLRLSLLYRESQCFQSVSPDAAGPAHEGVSILIEEPVSSRLNYLLTGKLLSYSLTNASEMELVTGNPPLSRIEHLSSDGTWVYEQSLAKDGEVLIPNTMGLPLPAGDTGQSFTVKTPNLFTRWRMTSGTYRLAVDYSHGSREDLTHHTVYAEFSFS